MQLFFVASCIFLSQNAFMPNSSSLKEKVQKGFKSPRFSLIASILCLLITCSSIIILVISFNNSVETVTWRSYDSNLPWENKQIQVINAESSWQSSENNERMALRCAYYPEVTLELGDCNTSGIIYLTFYNERGEKVGQTVNLSYTPSGFLSVSDANIKIDGKKAIAHLDTGFNTTLNYRLHCADEHFPLWHVRLGYMSEDENQIRNLGRISVELHKN